MLGAEPKILNRIAAFMQRVIIVDPQPAATKLLGELLRDICNCQIWTASGAAQGLVMAERIDPYIVFVGHSPGFDGAAFARDMRRSDFRCRKAPIIMITSEATASAIVAARDAGVHEFLRKPFTIKDLMRRLEAVCVRPREWVEAINYIGPDRRRFNSGDYSGPLKRRLDHTETSNEARIVQAFKILKAAGPALEQDPRQAVRAMLAQAEEIGAAAKAMSEAGLSHAAFAFRDRLSTADPANLKRGDLQPMLKELWRVSAATPALAGEPGAPQLRVA